ncbi:PREDICTED: phosphatidylglycerol/phosphatidylinositol transfer protein-like [Amphimedon queenslandica]|uniref:MD-2-related lipid-recognition domain-containing protein n=1 Tax=Amphimedon queenslandica TaxID=400682 RepID=A0AAN0JD20_AMPQE|nr:PREDICTED: phosphatidylglycerol/phosphatidylinositol transfer protein-like [Amphimedon queenslandica]|eukprot:XP_019854884.1 PREDICTED: phosphatidylglycerol/phosphatidylinositol transfer protein-like [Amphimedon queenslandica]
MSVLLMILSVVLVVSTLTGSTNNYYNEPTDNKASFTDCSVTKKFIELTNFSMTKFPLKRGGKFHLQAILNIKRTIHWGILHATATYNFRNYTNITFFDVKYNLCDYFDDIIKHKCPIHPGLYHINSHTTMSKLLWPGQYYGKATAYNEKGEQIKCIMKQGVIE